jgi:hypothetical protein
MREASAVALQAAADKPANPPIRHFRVPDRPTDLPDGLHFKKAVKPLLKKYSAFQNTQITSISIPVPSHKRAIITLTQHSFWTRILLIRSGVSHAQRAAERGFP